MEHLNDVNDEGCAISAVNAHHPTLRNFGISVQERAAVLYAEPVCGVNRSRGRSRSFCVFDPSEVDIDGESAQPNQERSSGWLRPLWARARSCDGPLRPKSALGYFACWEVPTKDNVVRIVCSTALEVLSMDEVDGCTTTFTFSKTEDSLEFVSECDVIVRAHGRHNNIFLSVLDRGLQMDTFSGTPKPDFVFKKRVYKDKDHDNALVYCFLNVKHSAYIQVTDDGKITVGDDKADNRDPKPCERFSLQQNGSNVLYMFHDTAKGRKYLDYRRTKSVCLSQGESHGFELYYP